MTALAESINADNEYKWGRNVFAPLDPETLGRLSLSDNYAYVWSWVTLSGDVPHGGLISASAEMSKGKEWWLLATDGLFHTTNMTTSSATLSKVLDAKGKQK